MPNERRCDDALARLVGFRVSRYSNVALFSRRLAFESGFWALRVRRFLGELSLKHLSANRSGKKHSGQERRCSAEVGRRRADSVANMMLLTARHEAGLSRR